MGTVLTLIATLSILFSAPFFAARIMRKNGGIGKSILATLLVLFSTQMIAMLASHLGPLGGVLAIMGFLAAWYQTIKILYVTDTAETMVFMFWHCFCFLTMSSLLALITEPQVAWIVGLNWF